MTDTELDNHLPPWPSMTGTLEDEYGGDLRHPRIPRRRDEIGTGVWGWCLGSAVVLLLVLIGWTAWRG